MRTGRIHNGDRSDSQDTPERFLRTEDVEELARELEGTEDTVEIGLSQIGIDPDGFGPRDIAFVTRRLARYITFDEDANEWVRV